MAASFLASEHLPDRLAAIFRIHNIISSPGAYKHNINLLGLLSYPILKEHFTGARITIDPNPRMCYHISGVPGKTHSF
jgi:hypothetical protein